MVRTTLSSPFLSVLRRFSFFSSLQDKFRCRNSDKCVITPTTRKRCKRCRLSKCFNVGAYSTPLVETFKLRSNRVSFVSFFFSLARHAQRMDPNRRGEILETKKNRTQSFDQTESPDRYSSEVSTGQRVNAYENSDQRLVFNSSNNRSMYLTTNRRSHADSSSSRQWNEGDESTKSSCYFRSLLRRRRRLFSVIAIEESNRDGRISSHSRWFESQTLSIDGTSRLPRAQLRRILSE